MNDTKKEITKVIIEQEVFNVFCGLVKVVILILGLYCTGIIG